MPEIVFNMIGHFSRSAELKRAVGVKRKLNVVAVLPVKTVFHRFAGCTCAKAAERHRRYSHNYDQNTSKSPCYDVLVVFRHNVPS